MSFYAGSNKFLLKSKIRSGISFFNFFLNSNSFSLNLLVNFANINFNNKSFFLNFFSQFNLGGFFYKPMCRSSSLKTNLLFSLNFLDFISLHKFFLEEASIFNNYTAGSWKVCSIYNNYFFDIFSSFKNFFFNGFNISNLFLFLFNRIKAMQNYFFFSYSFFFNLFFFLIYFLK